MWYEIRQACPPTLSADPRVTSALAEKETELRDKADIEEMNSSLSIVDFRWEKVKQVNPKMAQFEATCLLYVKTQPDLKNADEAWLVIRGTVESAKASLLVTPKDKERGYIEFAFKGLKPSEWQEANYIVVSRMIEYPDMAYHLSAMMSVHENNNWETWTDRVNLGWYTDLD